MLVLTRRPGEALSIRPVWQLDPATPVEHLFTEGAIRIAITGVRGTQVRLGLSAHKSFQILREELVKVPDAGLLPEAIRTVLARKLRILKLVRRVSSESLAQAAGLSLTAVIAAESGSGAVYLDDVEKMAQVLKVSVGEVFHEAGGTVEERVILALLKRGE